MVGQAISTIASPSRIRAVHRPSSTVSVIPSVHPLLHRGMDVMDGLGDGRDGQAMDARWTGRWTL